jgi:uncharacterized protein
MEHFFYCRAKPGSEALWVQLTETHWSFMDRYADAMIARGPTLTADRATATGSMHMVELPGAAAARVFAFEEPRYVAGVYSEVMVRRWRNALGRTMWEFEGDAVANPRFLVIGHGSPDTNAASPAGVDSERAAGGDSQKRLAVPVASRARSGRLSPWPAHFRHGRHSVVRAGAELAPASSNDCGRPRSAGQLARRFPRQVCRASSRLPLVTRLRSRRSSAPRTGREQRRSRQSEHGCAIGHTSQEHQRAGRPRSQWPTTRSNCARPRSRSRAGSAWTRIATMLRASHTIIWCLLTHTYLAAVLFGAEVGDHGEHAPVGVVALGQFEFHEYAADVSLDRASASTRRRAIALLVGPRPSARAPRVRGQ